MLLLDIAFKLCDEDIIAFSKAYYLISFRFLNIGHDSPIPFNDRFIIESTRKHDLMFEKDLGPS